MGANTNNVTSHRKLIAFCDGFVTTTDPIGTILGYATGNRDFIGYNADRYSIRSALTADSLDPTATPIDRSLDEKVFKIAGNIAGLGFTAATYGITEFYYLTWARDNNNRRTQYSPAPN
jgi:hypothetical protein